MGARPHGSTKSDLIPVGARLRPSLYGLACTTSFQVVPFHRSINAFHAPDAAMKAAYAKVGSQILDEWLKKSGAEGQAIIKAYRGK